MRIVVIGVSHWHVPMYLEYLREIEDVQVVAVSDPNPQAVENAREFFPQAVGYADYRQLIAEQSFDLAMAHAPHDEMTVVAATLVEKGIPFHMEKPMGLDAALLSQVAREAERKNLFISVPLVTRMFGVAGRLLEMARAQTLGALAYYYFRLFAPGPHRYRDSGVGWMLDPSRAGDGPLFNFGPHAIDLFIELSRAVPDRVYAAATHAVHGLAIPDAVTVILQAGAAYGVAELSYTSPAGYDRHMIVRTPVVSYSGLPDSGEIWVADGQGITVDGPTFDEAYRLYTHDLVARFRDGRPPLAGIEQMVKILRVMNAAHRSLESGNVEPV